jgi:excisionase family DNA binding protein
MKDQWMSLSEAADVLGIHPSTVRNWSDQGTLPVHRTKGGHRRYRRSEIELWMQSQRGNGSNEADRIVQNALRSTRFQISEGALEAENWYRKLDDEAREQYRISGRALLQGLINYLNSDDEKAYAEAESLGYEYAARGRRYAMSSVEATNALLFFRNVLIESMLKVYEAAAVRSPYAWSNMLRKVSDFTDCILVTMLETYEAYERASR